MHARTHSWHPWHRTAFPGQAEQKAKAKAAEQRKAAAKKKRQEAAAARRKATELEKAAARKVRCGALLLSQVLVAHSLTVDPLRCIPT